MSNNTYLLAPLGIYCQICNSAVQYIFTNTDDDDEHVARAI
jgi:hypothetical protein